MTGRGQMSWPNGDRYEGEIIDGVRNGRGVMTYGDGGRYEGEWRNNEANGRGIMVWPNKQRYEGQWLNGNRHGHGLHVAAPGRQYQGEWRDDKPVDSTLAWGSPSSGSASRSSAQDAPAVAEVKLSEAKRGLVLIPPTPSNVAVARSKPAVALLAATAEPVRVKRGDVVRLGMAFRVDVGGSQEIKVEESYELSFQGKPLPNYPVQRAKARGAGEHSSVYSQQIPVAAAPGTYRFKGEVCFDGACSSRVSSFEIGP
jgi:hypothetical protein